MRRYLRREFTADYVVLAYSLAYYAWLCLRTPGTRSTAIIGDVSFIPMGLIIGLAFLRNARLQFLDRRTRLAWAILGGGALTLWLIGNTWPRLIDYFGASAFPAWVGHLEIVHHVLLIVAFLVFPGRSLTGRERTRFAADVGLILLAGFVLAFHYGARASLHLSPANPPLFALTQSLLDWAVFVTAAAGVLHKRDGITRGALLWLLAANTLYLAANYVLSHMTVYRMGDAVDGLWFAAWICRWIGARFAWHEYRGAGAPGTPAAVIPVTNFRSGVFSYVLVAAAFAMLVGRVAMGELEHLGLFALSATAMAGLLLLRQVVELRENRRLFTRRIAQEARFRSLVQNASDAVLVVGAQGRLSYVSPSATRVLGVSHLLEGSSLADIVSADDAAGLGWPEDGTPSATRRRQCRVRSATGAWRDIEIAATDLRADPAVGGIVLNCRDLTERNELERHLRQAQKLDAVGHLAGGLAHDFNNVLTAIRGYTELLREDLPPSTRTSTDLLHIEEAVERAAAVTQKLLAFSRKQAVRPVALNLNTVLTGLDPLLRQLLTDRIDVQTAHDPELWSIRADQGQMEQVVINLVTNARDAMPHGGCLQIRTYNHRQTQSPLETDGLRPGDYVALVVRDQGIGMPEAVRCRIFEPFFSTKSRDRGIGLGLAMVHAIVTQSGGHVTVESVDGHGATFTVFLPRVAVSAATLRTTPARDEAS